MEDLRTHGERRELTFATLTACAINPRRTTSRRSHDRRFAQLDVFGGGELLLAAMLMLLSVMDGFFTLNLIAMGGSELNPVMNYFLGQGVWVFMWVKVCLTALPAVLLVAAGNHLLFQKVRVRALLAAAVGAYLGLIIYEIALLMHFG